MINLLSTEFLKLKRSQLFLISMLGAATSPFVCFIAYLGMKSKKPGVPILFNEVFSETNLYLVLLIGVTLYGVITAYLFNREYTENTLKNILTIPISRTRLFMSKLILLLIWILFLTMFAWGLTLIFGVIGQFQGLSAAVLMTAFKEYIVGGVLLFLLVTPTILVTLLCKNYVPSIVFTVALTMVNVLIGNSEYRVLYPWSAVLVIAWHDFITQYPPVYSYLSIFATSLLGLLAAVIYFKKEEIH